MNHLASGARRLPMHHVSIRVPWHDGRWAGTVCSAPKANNACLVLPRLQETRKDDYEAGIAGKSWQDLSFAELPPCHSERGAFMAPFEFTRYEDHPYALLSEAHRHFDRTPIRHPAYSAHCIPFGWMLKDRAAEHVERLGLGFRQELEDELHERMRFETNWVQVKDNQLAMLDTFFGAIEPERSLCLFYAKDTPLTEDPRRVIVGVGRVKAIGPAVEYRYSSPGALKAMLWDRTIQHSIQPPQFEDGFLFPYHDLLDQAAISDLDPSQFVAFAPEDAWAQFSYGAEHVTHDIAVASLLVCADVLKRTSEVLPGPWLRHVAWIDNELNRLWKLRGPYPGLGSALKAFGFAGGALVAYDLALAQEQAHQEWAEDPWDLVDQAMKDPSVLGAVGRGHLDETKRKAYLKLTPQRKALLKLLSRFTLTAEQATRYYQETVREEAGLAVSDKEILQNPYLLYELDRAQPDPILVGAIDRGLFPDPVVATRFPVPTPSAPDGDVDPRRSRALAIHVLERAAGSGHTLQPRADVVQAVRKLELSPPCPLSLDVLTVVEDCFPPAVRTTEMADGSTAYQLERLHDVSEVIRSTVEKRLKGRRFESSNDWPAIVDQVLPARESETSEDEARLEDRARQEKSAALSELYSSRISVLTGPAGTGKTTLLRALCELQDVKKEGLLLLAPTGKARVRMETLIGVSGAQTIAQFLVPLGRYLPETGRYRLAPDRDKVTGHGTVIIDEASMLTEEQFAAVLDALRPPNRLILVGDPKQLPPIGAGRPFVDIVRRLTPTDLEARFPRVAPAMAELTVQRRHRGQQRLDLQLAEWFTGRDPGVGADEIWDRLLSGSSRHISLVPWEREEQLQDLLLKQLKEELKLASLEDEDAFEKSLGGTPFANAVFFHPTRDEDKASGREASVGAASGAENWQILSPVRVGQAGVKALNRKIQTQFRPRARQWAEPETWYERRVPKPLGRDGILYGDKVINVVNGRRRDVWPTTFRGRGTLEYVANGEIGIVVGDYKGRNQKGKLPWKLEVEFASQQGFKYGYKPGEFKEEGDQLLELAYALTIHKTQGSEFGLTFLVLPNPCRLLSPELLYTALTRQKERIIVFHQGDLAALKKYSRTYYSETARRMTNLLAAPAPVPLNDRFLERELIHRTRRGEAVASKSEVVIADLLFSLNIDYEYEKELVGADGSRRWPDFTIDSPETGVTVYWEHLGMLSKPEYQERWQRKLVWYENLKVKSLDQGGGPNGLLVTSEDDERGGIDSGKIEALARRVFGL